MEKLIIGRTEAISLPKEAGLKVPAKIDTGADSSSVWASDIVVDDDGRLHFKLFAPGSPHFTGKEHVKKKFKIHFVRSSNGQAQIRYAVKMPVIIKNRRVQATFTLADRSKNMYPILIGCRLLKGKFIVDVQRGSQLVAGKQFSEELSLLSRQDPKTFYELHYKSQKELD